MTDFHAVLTRREGHTSILSILSSAGSEVERILCPRHVEPKVELDWAGKALVALHFERVADWRTYKHALDESTHQVMLRFRPTS